METVKSLMVSEKVKAVKAMEYLARQINDEEIFEEWLLDGVADGDIDYGDLDVKDEDPEALDYYLEEDNFRDVLRVFLRVMSRARKSGGLWCGGVGSR